MPGVVSAADWGGRGPVPGLAAALRRCVSPAAGNVRCSYGYYRPADSNRWFSCWSFPAGHPFPRAGMHLSASISPTACQSTHARGITQKALQEYRISLPLALIVRRLSRRRNLIQPADPRRRNQRNPRDRECDRSRLRDGGCAQRQRRIDKPLYGTLKILATSTSSHHAVYELLVLFRQLGRN